MPRARKPSPSRIPAEVQFFMVCPADPQDGDAVPEVRHDKHPGALREAYRLARLTGREFLVVKAKNLASPDHPLPADKPSADATQEAA
tara:strand:+ start:44069 stop:44332 length:264 start_codon:yes stop_codon:yes gene_type:complete